MAESSVKVAVRVRPYNAREKAEGAELCVEMNGTMTRVFNKETNYEKIFYFDYSYWSHDGFVDDPQTGVSAKASPTSSYADQQTVFDDLGVGVLNNAWDGYHCCLFAYGQTGAGKSYSMVGYGGNKGIIPIACEEIFKRINERASPYVNFEVGCSMLEIYNEQIQDLLQPPNNRVKGGLRVREDKSKGVYVENLVFEKVTSFEEINNVLEKGNKHRTVAATQMNATSSRAHTVLTISFKQIFFDQETGQPLNRKESNINLVDLAGSERASKTGATGSRLQEGSNINKSLSTLGRVITALAKRSSGALGRNEVVPYRESQLTRILQNALGGNSKTTMIAAISPALFNFDETLSTLRYADQVKSIKNAAVVNETPQERLIRELKEENERLKAMLDGKAVDGGGVPEGEKADYQRKIEELKRAKEEAEKTWQQRLQEHEERISHQLEAVAPVQELEKPYLTNLNEDPLLTGYIKHVIQPGRSVIGRKNPEQMPNIVIEGLGIGPSHCVITLEDETYMIEPAQDTSLRTMVNGKLLTEPVELEHNTRLRFGNHNFFIFKDPEELDNKDYDWEFAVNEANEEEAQGLLGNQAEELKQKEEEMKAQLEAEMEEARRKIEEEKAEVDKMLNSHEEVDAAAKKAAAEREHELRLRQQRIEEEYKKKQEALKEHEAERNALERLKKLLTHAIQEINEANERADLLSKRVQFTPELYGEGPAGKRRGLQDTRVRIKVNYPELSENMKINWSLEKLEERLVDMREICNQLQYATDPNEPLEVNEDPFMDELEDLGETYQLIGTAYVFLDVLTYLLPLDLDFVPIINDRGMPNGSLKVGLVGKVKGAESDNHELKDYVGKELEASLEIVEAADIPKSFCTNVYCEYSNKLFGGETFKTPVNEDTTTVPVFHYQHKHKVEITTAVLEELTGNSLTISVYGDMSQEERLRNMHRYRQNLQKSMTLAPGQSILSPERSGDISMYERSAVPLYDEEAAEEVRKEIDTKMQQIQLANEALLKRKKELEKADEDLRKAEKSSGLSQTTTCTCGIF